MIRSKVALISIAVALHACSSSDDEEDKVDYTAFDTADVQALIDRGEYDQALKIIREQDVLEVANKEDHLQEADILMKRLDGVAAEVALEKARKGGAEEAGTSISMAKALMMQRKLEEAEEELDKYDYTGDEHYEALLMKGDISLEDNEFEKAAEFYNEAVKLDPEKFRAYAGLAQLDLMMGRFESAHTLAQKAAGLTDDDPLIEYLLGATAKYKLDFETAKNHLQKSISLQSPNDLAYLELAGIYVDEENYPLAREALQKVYENTPEHPMARFYSALMLATEGDLQTAEELLLRAQEITRRYPPAIRTYGHVTFRLGKYVTAIPYLEDFLKLVPSDRVTRLILAESYGRRGYAKKSLQTLEPLLKADSTDLDAHLLASAVTGMNDDVPAMRGWLKKAKKLAESKDPVDQALIDSLTRRLALTDYSRGDKEQAIAELAELSGASYTDMTSTTLLVNMLLDSNKLAEAEEVVTKMVEQHPDAALSYNLMGAVRYKQRRFEEAIVHYSKALSITPDYMSALKNRGVAYVSINNYARAKPDLEAVLKRFPDDHHVEGMLGRTYLELGEGRDAIRLLEKAEHAYPNSAIILADHAEALASIDYTSSAITKANKAKKLAAGNAGLIEYLDGKIAEWLELESGKTAEKVQRRADIERAVTIKMEEKAKLEAERLKAEEAKALEDVEKENGATEEGEPEAEGSDDEADNTP
ncbi:tetratricopeptide repeat protein [Kordiimonas pumila]|uniref:Tetratricopeptide repeat protein n=1 Tax=Kordiimonas pumila TaxID=2161677 RepID=A0ABV7D1X1_9PROT|nr:tetratricopeptide repeat protein [Kordiimonas pumila]